MKRVPKGSYTGQYKHEAVRLAWEVGPAEAAVCPVVSPLRECAKKIRLIGAERVQVLVPRDDGFDLRGERAREHGRIVGIAQCTYSMGAASTASAISR